MRSQSLELFGTHAPINPKINEVITLIYIVNSICKPTDALFACATVYTETVNILFVMSLASEL